MRFLITGSAGFIGFHLARRLLSDGHSVTGFDGMTDYYDVNLKYARRRILEGHDGYVHVAARLEDKPAIESAFAVATPDIVIHLAAQAGVRYSIEAPQTYIDSNLVGSWNILEAARETRPRHLLMASTSSVYGANHNTPFKEADKADEPLNLYAATKKGMEAMAFSYASLFSLPTTTLRFFTVYGPWGRPDMALFKFVAAIREGRPIDVYGHGNMGRDFTYIDDLVEAVTRLLPLTPSEETRVSQPNIVDSLSSVAPYRTVNIAHGTPVRLMAFIKVIERVLGKQAELNLMPTQPGEMVETHGDAGLLRALAGDLPQAPIEQGVSAFVDWYQSYYNG